MADSSAALVPIDQAEVEFYGDSLTATLVDEDGTERVYIPIRPVCEFIGVDWSAQRQRINRDPVLREEVRSVVVTTTQLDRVAGQRATQEMLCLPDTMLHGWLFGINAARAKPEVREALIRYQRECYSILARAFSRKDLEQRRALQQVEAIAMATAELARRQLEQGVDIGRAHDRLDRAGIFVRDLAVEVAELRERLGLGRPITSEQAEAVRQRVDNVAGLLGGVPGYGGRRKPHAAVWSELKRLFGVPSYRELTVGQYGAVAAFLDKWAGEISEALEAGGEDGRQDA